METENKLYEEDMSPLLVNKTGPTPSESASPVLTGSFENTSHQNSALNQEDSVEENVN